MCGGIYNAEFYSSTNAAPRLRSIMDILFNWYLCADQYSFAECCPCGKSTGCNRDAKGLSVCFLVRWIITRAKGQRCGARNSLCCIVQKNTGWPDNNKTVSARSISTIFLSVLSCPFLCSSGSSSLCLSPHLCHSFSHRKEKRNVHARRSHLSAHTQEMAIYRLLSLHWNSQKLPLASLWAVSIATVFCFPQWQKERDRSSKRERKAGWDNGTREVNVRGWCKAKKWKERKKVLHRQSTGWSGALQALSGFSCSGLSAQPTTTLHKLNSACHTTTFTWVTFSSKQ